MNVDDYTTASTDHDALDRVIALWAWVRAGRPATSDPLVFATPRLVEAIGLLDRGVLAILERFVPALVVPKLEGSVRRALLLRLTDSEFSAARTADLPPRVVQGPHEVGFALLERIEGEWRVDRFDFPAGPL